MPKNLFKKKIISVCFPAAPRLLRKLTSNYPKEFYYGTSELKKIFNIEFVNSRASPSTVFLKLLLFFEKIYNRFTNFGIYKTRILQNLKHISRSDMIISFNDAYSINLGLFYPKKFNQKTIGVFQGLSDFENRIPFFFVSYFNKLLKKSLNSLDHCLFLGEADLKNIKKKFNLTNNKISQFIFGIDEKFWTPNNNIKETIDILCVGSDLNRDYKILKHISSSIKIKLITSLKIDLKKFKNIEQVTGNFHDSKITDEQLRKYYQSSKIVLIPTKNVFQPSGQSVALQAMSCGKTVLMSKTKGIFNKKKLKNMKNIVFFEVGSSHSMNKKITLLLNDKSLRKNIGKLARNTVIKNFTVNHMSYCLKKIIIKLL